MADEQVKVPVKVYALTVFGKTVAQFRTREEAVKLKKELEEEPWFLSDIHEWEPEEWMLPHIKFDEDEK